MDGFLGGACPRLGLDTAVFFYHLEQHQGYACLPHALLSGAEAGRWKACTSVVTLMELTVRTWQLGQPDVVLRYENALAHFPNLSLMDVTREVARQAAHPRTAYRLRPTDALQAATALVGNATLLVTNDAALFRRRPRWPCWYWMTCWKDRLSSVPRLRVAWNALGVARLTRRAAGADGGASLCPGSVVHRKGPRVGGDVPLGIQPVLASRRIPVHYDQADLDEDVATLHDLGRL